MDKTAAVEIHRMDRAVVVGRKTVDQLELLQAQDWGTGRDVKPRRGGLGRTWSGTGNIE